MDIDEGNLREAQHYLERAAKSSHPDIGPRAEYMLGKLRAGASHSMLREECGGDLLATLVRRQAGKPQRKQMSEKRDSGRKEKEKPIPVVVKDPWWQKVVDPMIKGGSGVFGGAVVTAVVQHPHTISQWIHHLSRWL